MKSGAPAGGLRQRCPGKLLFMLQTFPREMGGVPEVPGVLLCPELWMSGLLPMESPFCSGDMADGKIRMSMGCLMERGTRPGVIALGEGPGQFDDGRHEVPLVFPTSRNWLQSLPAP